MFAYDTDKKKVRFEVVGVKTIAKLTDKKQRVALNNTFTETANNNIHEHNRTNTNVDILIGLDHYRYFPIPQQYKNNTALMRNRFGYITAGSISCNQITEDITMLTESFFEIESLGVQCTPKCGGCKCGKCHPGGSDMTLKEEEEYNLIISNIVFNPKRGRWLAKLPWIEDPKNLPYNKPYASAVLKSLKKRLNKHINKNLYSAEMQRMLDAGTARRVTKHELESYTGPKYFLTHHPIWKLESKSTPCRIVFNSSAKYKGKSMNDHLAKGPSLLNSLPGVLLRWRQGRIGFAGDIAKMFHSIDIPVEDQMTHLFLWSEEENVEPDVRAITTVNMGDKPSSTIAQGALQKTAERESVQYPEESKIICDNTYMDDILGSVDTEADMKRVTKNIEAMLSKAGFHVKEWAYSFQKGDMKSIQKIMTNEKVLGLQWNPLLDTCVFIELPHIGENKASKRIIMSCVHRIYDPLGLLTAFILKFKLLLRLIWADEEKFDWDDILPDNLQEEWLTLKAELESVSEIQFKRPLTPEDAIGQPQLIIFSDGSSLAFGAVAYARWETPRGFEMRLIMSKCKVAPIKIIDIVRLELCGALLGTRLRTFITKETRMNFKQTFHFTDSEIVKAMMNKSSYGFDTFEANRLGEMQRNSNKQEWFWLPGSLNIADLITRGCSPENLNIDSPWQNGLDVFKEPEEVWTQFKAPVPEVIPGLKKQNRVTIEGQTFIVIDGETFQTAEKIEVTDSLAARFNISRFSQYNRLLRVTARILAAYRPPPALKNIVLDVSASQLKQAEIFWVREAQREISDEDLKHKFVRLSPKRQPDGLITVGHRMEKWQQVTYNNNKLLLLPFDHPMAKLYVLGIHNSLHLSGYTSIAATTSRVRLKFWITRLEIMVKSIKHKCVECRKINKARLKESQSMAQLPLDRLKPAPAWYSITIDFFGPIEIRGEVNKRSRGKAYGVIFTCNLVRAVHIELSPDYSTDSFLLALRRFMSVRGTPSKIRSDRGSQLVGANRELKQMINGLDIKTLMRFGAEEGIEWDFSPAEAPWYNGCAESMVRAAKKALQATLKGQIVTYSELITVISEVANLLNERPIGKQSNDIEDGSYLCPNDLLLGRATSRIPGGPFEEYASSKKRFNYVQSIVDAFWVKMTRFYFPSLIVEQKWHTSSRNVCVGDIVLLQDSNALRGEWRLARISKTHPSSDGKVRKVTLSYRHLDNTINYKGGALTNIERPVQNLVVILAAEDST